MICFLLIAGLSFCGILTTCLCIDNYELNQIENMKNDIYRGQNQEVKRTDATSFIPSFNEEYYVVDTQELNMTHLSYFAKREGEPIKKQEPGICEKNCDQSYQADNIHTYPVFPKIHHIGQNSWKIVKTEWQQTYSDAAYPKQIQCNCEKSVDLPSTTEAEDLIQDASNNDGIRQYFEEMAITIEKSNAQWNTSFSSSVIELMNQQAKGLGYIDEHILDDQTVTYDGTAPDIFDWRNVNGTDWTTPIKNQNGCGSCTAFGILGALEAIVQIHVGTPFTCDLSEGHLFFCSGGLCHTGLKISDAINYLKTFGVSDELCYPYSLMNTGRGKMPLGWEKRTVKITHASAVSDSFNNIKNALLKYGPVITSLYVYEDFYLYDGGIYSHLYGKFIGHHCVTIVGYNNKDSYWICKNSWGTQWGENGWFRIKYGQCNIGENTIFLSGISGNIQPFQPSNPTPSHNTKNIMCNTTLTWMCTDPDNDELMYRIYFAEGDNLANNDLVKIQHKNPYYQVTNLKSNTTYSWKIIAEDEHGSQSESKIWKFTTRETILPHVKIIHPQSGYMYWKKIRIPLPCATPIIIGEFEVQGIANDSSGIKDVIFYVNDIYRASISQEPYTWKWTEHSFGLKLYKITMEASDTQGNNARDEILVRVFHP